MISKTDDKKKGQCCGWLSNPTARHRGWSEKHSKQLSTRRKKKHPIQGEGE